MSGSPRHALRINTLFTKEQQAWLTMKYGSLKSTPKLMCTFRLYFGLTLRQAPSYNAFLRLVQRFTASKGQVRPQVISENRPPKEKVVQKVKDLGT